MGRTESIRYYRHFYMTDDGRIIFKVSSKRWHELSKNITYKKYIKSQMFKTSLEKLRGDDAQNRIE